MRIDQFLNATNLVKSRKIAQDMIDSKVVCVNGVIAKSSKKIMVGDAIVLTYLDYAKHYKILQIPTAKHTKKSDQALYVQEVQTGL